MESMYGNEYGIIVLVRDLDDFMYTPLVVTHPDKSAEYAYTIIYVHYIIADIERGQVIDGKLLALFDSPPDADPVKSVENLMVRIAAYLVPVIYESAMYILSGTEFGLYSTVLYEY